MAHFSAENSEMALAHDWSHETVELAGMTTAVKVAHVRLRHSRMPFIRAYPREAQEMMFDAHDREFAFFRGAARCGIYDKIEKVTQYPPNSLMVKVNYTKNRKLTGITAMLKVPGYDPADRNWLMAAYSPSGKKIAYGKVPACIACHNFVRAADFNFAPPPDQLLPVPVWKAFFPKDTISPAYAELLNKHPDAIVK